LLRIRLDVLGEHKVDELVWDLMENFLCQFLRALLDVFLELNELNDISSSKLAARVS